MTIDIEFGKITKFSDVEWDIEKQNDGANPMYTIFPGLPIRSFATFAYYNFLDRNKEVEKLHNICKPKYPDTNDSELKQIDTDFIKLVEKIPFPEGTTDKIKCDIDRIKWLKFWTKLCYETFGKDAYIRIY